MHIDRGDLRNEDGWVLVTAIVLLSVMLTVTLASFSLVDTGQGNSRQQRERETSLNVAEGALYSQGFTLAQGWPGNEASAPSMPENCTQASTSTLCPTAAMLTATGATVTTQSFTNVDARSGSTWMTKVRDNGGPLANSYVATDADQGQSGTNIQTGASYTCSATCRWDANGDKQLWVQARAIVKRRTRDVVALMKLENLLEATPETALTAGGIKINNNGNKIMLYGEGSQIVVRCDTQRNNCVLSQPGQIQPSPVTVAAPPFMTATQLARFKQRAVTDGRYYPGCPDDNLWGAVVWVENCNLRQLTNSLPTQPCSPPPPASPGGGGTPLSPRCVNQLTKPGILIWHCGSMDFSGNWTYVGVLYGVNNSDGTCAASSYQAVGDGNCNGNNNNHDMVISMTGGFGVWGVMAIDGLGCLYAGSNAIQLHYDPNVFGAVSSYGSVGLVQNTWRELPPT